MSLTAPQHLRYAGPTVWHPPTCTPHKRWKNEKSSIVQAISPMNRLSFQSRSIVVIVPSSIAAAKRERDEGQVHPSCPFVIRIRLAASSAPTVIGDRLKGRRRLRHEEQRQVTVQMVRRIHHLSNVVRRCWMLEKGAGMYARQGLADPCRRALGSGRRAATTHLHNKHRTAHCFCPTSSAPHSPIAGPLSPVSRCRSTSLTLHE